MKPIVVFHLSEMTNIVGPIESFDLDYNYDIA